ncbi:MAG TPA: acyltransferase [Elainellaceae cyanobacterium]
MTLLSTLLSLFPTLVMAMAGASFIWMCVSPGILSIGALVLSLYGVPLMVYRLHAKFYPVQEGISYLRGTDYSPWWGSHQIQIIYIAVPILETLLRLIPGAFSLWLRLWGAQIGRDVYWTPRLELADRGLIQVGDRTVIGNGVSLYSHAIKPKKGNLLLYVKPIIIGRDAFVGGGCRLAPGVTVPDGACVPTLTDLFPNRTADDIVEQEDLSCAG